jgi:hypothetical protein
MVVGRRDTWFVSALKDEGKTKTGVGKKVEIMMIRVRQILHLSHLTKLSRCDGLNVGMLFMSLKKLVEIRVTVAPVSISKFVLTPFTFALINIPASGASLCTPTEPGVLSDGRWDTGA